MIKGILLDFNGVVIDDEPIQMRVYQELLAAEDITLTDAEYHECLGMDDRRFVEAAYERAGRTPETNKVLEMTLKKSQKWHDAISDGVPLFPGMDNFIRKIANDFAVGIVSMSRREDIEYILERTGLAGQVSVIVSAGDVANCKPDPECYRKGFHDLDLVRIAQGHLPMTHGECLVIEDSPAGVAAAKAADLPVLGVTNTVSADQLRTAGADWVARDLNDWMPSSIRRVFA